MREGYLPTERRSDRSIVHATTRRSRRAHQPKQRARKTMRCAQLRVYDGCDLTAETYPSALTFFTASISGRHDGLEVADDAEARGLEDVRVGVLVDGDDVLRAGAAGHVLAGAGHGDGDVERRADDLAGQADLLRDRPPAEVGDRAARADGAAEQVRQLFDHVEVLRTAEAAAAGDDDVGVFEPHALGRGDLALEHLRADAGGVERHLLDGARRCRPQRRPATSGARSRRRATRRSC